MVSSRNQGKGVADPDERETHNSRLRWPDKGRCRGKSATPRRRRPLRRAWRSRASSTRSASQSVRPHYKISFADRGTRARNSNKAQQRAAGTHLCDVRNRLVRDGFRYGDIVLLEELPRPTRSLFDRDASEPRVHLRVGGGSGNDFVQRLNENFASDFFLEKRSGLHSHWP